MSSEPPAVIRSLSLRRSPSVAGGRMKSVKNAAPSTIAMPRYESTRPASSTGFGGGAEGPTSGIAGSGPLPITNANAPWVSWPSTADRVFHETR
jgi:hypothetical protein